MPLRRPVEGATGCCCWKTQQPASEVLIAIPDEANERNLFAIEIPKLGSFIASGNWTAREIGLETVASWRNVERDALRERAGEAVDLRNVRAAAENIGVCDGRGAVAKRCKCRREGNEVNADKDKERKYFREDCPTSRRKN